MGCSPQHDRKSPVKAQGTQQSPLRRVKTQQIVLDDGHTISVRIEGKIYLFYRKFRITF